LPPKEVGQLFANELCFVTSFIAFLISSTDMSVGGPLLSLLPS
jgi:hypothetical protein